MTLHISNVGPWDLWRWLPTMVDSCIHHWYGDPRSYFFHFRSAPHGLSPQYWSAYVPVGMV